LYAYFKVEFEQEVPELKEIIYHLNIIRETTRTLQKGELGGRLGNKGNKD
jgi:hypothetical protein